VGTTEFSASELHVLSRVLRQACADIGPVDDQIKSKIANRILSLACDGERDFETLRRHAISGLGREASRGAAK
jgi:hypothetical protein